MTRYRILFITENRYVNRKYRTKEIAENDIGLLVAAYSHNKLSRQVFAYEFEVVEYIDEYWWNNGADVVIYTDEN